MYACVCAFYAHGAEECLILVTVSARPPLADLADLRADLRPLTNLFVCAEQFCCFTPPLVVSEQLPPLARPYAHCCGFADVATTDPRQEAALPLEVSGFSARATASFRRPPPPAVPESERSIDHGVDLPS